MLDPGESCDSQLSILIWEASATQLPWKLLAIGRMLLVEDEGAL